MLNNSLTFKTLGVQQLYHIYGRPWPSSILTMQAEWVMRPHMMAPEFQVAPNNRNNQENVLDNSGCCWRLS